MISFYPVIPSKTLRPHLPPRLRGDKPVANIYKTTATVLLG